eukprot:scaffold5806_cov171-Ochromonas_danica.AAC.6
MSKELSDLESTYLDNLQKITSSSSSSSTTHHDEEEVVNLKQQNLKMRQDITLLTDRSLSKLSEKKAIALNLIRICQQFSQKLDSDLVLFEADLKGVGDYEAPPGIPPETEVAFSVTAESSHGNDGGVAGGGGGGSGGGIVGTLILGSIIQYRSEIASYDILDVDDKQKYTIPEGQVHLLGQMDLVANGNKKLSKGDRIYALYPDTTIFYPALVIQAPRRNALNAEAIVVVQFEGDEDPTTGLVPNRIVQLKYTLRFPP